MLKRPNLISVFMPGLLIAALGGCTSPARERAAALRAAEQQRAEAAKTRFWAAQAAQQPRPVSDAYELIPLAVPERAEAGAVRIATVEFLRVPRTP